MAGDFATEAELSLTIPDRELSQARSRIEAELGEIEVGVNASADGDGGGRQMDAMLSATEGQRDNLAIQSELMEEGVEYLREIADDIDDMGGMFGGGGGGGGGGGFLAGVGSGRAAGALGALAGGTSLSLAGLAVAGIGIGEMSRRAGGESQGGLTGGVTSPSDATTQPRPETTGEGGFRFDFLKPLENLDQQIGDFEWPQLSVEDMLMPISQSITSNFTWNVPTADDIVTDMTRGFQPPSIGQIQANDIIDGFTQGFTPPNIQAPSADDILDEIARSIDVDFSGLGDIQVDFGDIVNNIDANLDDIVDEAVDAVQNNLDTTISNLERRIERGLNR